MLQCVAMCLKTGADNAHSPDNVLSPLSKHYGGIVVESSGGWKVIPNKSSSPGVLLEFSKRKQGYKG